MGSIATTRMYVSYDVNIISRCVLPKLGGKIQNGSANSNFGHRSLSLPDAYPHYGFHSSAHILLVTNHKHVPKTRTQV